MDTNMWRHPYQEDKQLLDKLLSESFPGRSAIREQLQMCQVRNFDENGSLEFLISADAPRADVLYVIPAEGFFQDSDGVLAHALLHVVNGIATEIEVFKEDNSVVQDKRRFKDIEILPLG